MACIGFKPQVMLAASSLWFFFHSTSQGDFSLSVLQFFHFSGI